MKKYLAFILLFFGIGCICSCTAIDELGSRGNDKGGSSPKHCFICANDGRRDKRNRGSVGADRRFGSTNVEERYVL